MGRAARWALVDLKKETSPDSETRLPLRLGRRGRAFDGRTLYHSMSRFRSRNSRTWRSASSLAIPYRSWILPAN
jgi:hypothetical protein